MQHSSLVVRHLGLQPYETIWHAMQAFTNQRTAETPDEIWIVEHPPVYTQGQAGKPEHLLHMTSIPIVQTDRGGQVTYHGPGQLVFYPLLDVRRLGLGVRELVTALEQSVVLLLQKYGIESAAKPDAPGVYVDGSKIASLGLRIRHGRSFHGLALNVVMDLSPFQHINPCGYAGLAMTQCSSLGGPQTVAEAAQELLSIFTQQIGITQWHDGEPVVYAPACEETHD